jgi:hypothetical protein
VAVRNNKLKEDTMSNEKETQENSDMAHEPVLGELRRTYEKEFEGEPFLSCATTIGGKHCPEKGIYRIDNGEYLCSQCYANWVERWIEREERITVKERISPRSGKKIQSTNIYEELMRMVRERETGVIYYDAKFHKILLLTQLYGNDAVFIANTIYTLCVEAASMRHTIERLTKDR